MHKKIILLILDGWGIAKEKNYSAIDKAATPFIDKLLKNYPNSKLKASGTSVGLPNNTMGNSEVGHMNIGAGRIVLQSLMRINQSIDKKELNKNPTLLRAFNYAKINNCNIHLIGLISDGGIHSHINHLKALCTIAKENQVKNLYIHAFTDGRDANPKSSISFFKDLEKHLKFSVGQLATIMGRYYAMDRDKRWERTKIAYDALVRNIGYKTHEWEKSILQSYNNGITDEFIKPIVLLNEKQKPIISIKENDVVINFNFRTDRPKQITEMLTQKTFEDLDTKSLNLKYLTFTNYDENFKNIEVLFKKEKISNTLGEVLSKEGLSQLRIAETEKYSHVTYFFSGRRQQPFKGEIRIMCPSQKVATYDLKPEMSAEIIKDKAIEIIKNEEINFICLNFANADMVGHTGDFSATIKACETIDHYVKEIVEASLENEYIILITSDHGNADKMFDKDKNPFTTHTKNDVPFIVLDKDKSITKNLKNGVLADIAPTILKLMHIKKPDEMINKSLI